MKKKDNLINNLEDVISSYNNKRKVKQQLIEFFKKYSFNAGDISAYWTGNTNLESASDNMLLLLSYCLFEITKRENINPEDYFSQVEIQDGLRWKNHTRENPITYPLVIDNVIEVIPNRQWLTLMSAKKLRQWYYDIPLTYNFNTQRQAKYKMNSEGKIIQCKSTNAKSVTEIRNRLLEHKQFPDTITLNLLQDGRESIQYNVSKHQLIIYQGELDIADGDHRISALLEYLNMSPESDIVYELRITNYDEQTMCDFIEQVQTVNKISTIKKESINTVKPSNRCVQRIQTNRSDFGKLISDSADLIRLSDKLTLFTTINQAIEYIYKINKNKSIVNKEINDIADRISEVVDEIIGLNIEAFMTNKKKIKQESFINSNNIFIGYIALAKVLPTNYIWKSQLKAVMDSIDFSRNNEELIKFSLDNLQVNLKAGYIKTIADYFTSKVGDYNAL